MGVLYSRSGFSAPAIRKAKANGVSCCRFFENEPARGLPESLVVPHFIAVLRLKWVFPANFDAKLTWGEFFDLKSNQFTLIDLVLKKLHELESEQISKAQHSGGIPANLAIDFSLSTGTTFRVEGHWRFFQAVLEAYLLEGEYVVTAEKLSASITSPLIDLHSANPGPGWKEISRPQVPASGDKCVLILGGGLFPIDELRSQRSAILQLSSKPTSSKARLTSRDQDGARKKAAKP